MRRDLERRRFLQSCFLLLGGAICGAAEVTIEDAAVASSFIEKIGYSKAARVLEIQLRSRARYRYRGVPEAVWVELMRAESKGRYFSKNIREKYPCERVAVP